MSQLFLLTRFKDDEDLDVDIDLQRSTAPALAMFLVRSSPFGGHVIDRGNWGGAPFDRCYSAGDLSGYTAWGLTCHMIDDD